MNELGDEFVSFNCLNLVATPDQNHVIATTDNNRSIMFKVGTHLQARNFYGTVNNEFSRPTSIVDISSSLLFSTSQDQNIYVFDMANEQIIHQYQGHNAVIRDLAINPNDGQLASCSYDKTVKIWSWECI
eukprot:TRINITY_DN6790_c2_g1_i2.p1 TRINITY_DN6790_c2_g1~~TRINITY_DN6790_c2_g1_i2.p1  ORF type:complete len:130 (+),score=12.99 TRINITY_DN6790_c2_g1_i2:118-507(+)